MWSMNGKRFEAKSKRDVISGQLLARWKHQQLEGNQRSVQTPHVDLFSPSPPPPTPFSVTYARRLVLPSRYIATSHSTSVNHSREPDVDTAKTAGHFFSSSTRELACSSMEEKDIAFAKGKHLFFFSSLSLSLSSRERREKLSCRVNNRWSKKNRWLKRV